MGFDSLRDALRIDICLVFQLDDKLPRIFSTNWTAVLPNSDREKMTSSLRVGSRRKVPVRHMLWEALTLEMRQIGITMIQRDIDY